MMAIVIVIGLIIAFSVIYVITSSDDDKPIAFTAAVSPEEGQEISDNQN